MVSATGATPFTGVADTLFSTTTPSVSSDSFTQQLEVALEQYLQQSGSNTQLEINIQPSQSQESGTSQFLVTVTEQPATTPSAPAASSTSTATAATTASASPSTASSAPTAQDAPPDQFVTVPFGNGYSNVPTLATELANQDAMMESTMMTPAAILNQDLVSQAGDPMAGQPVPDTNLNWDNLTQDQRVAYMYATNVGLPQGQTMQQYLESNVGPSIMANAPSNDPTFFGTA
jgi:hypothetical protein